MKVMFHCADYPPRISGVGGYMRNMACALAANGHKVVVVTSRVEGAPDEETTDYGVIYRAYDHSEARSRKVAEIVLAIAKDHQVDFIEGADHFGECASLLKIKNRPPVKVKYHGCQAMTDMIRSNECYSWQRATIWASLLRYREQVAAEKYSLEHADFASAPCRWLVDRLRLQGLHLPANIEVIEYPFLPVKNPMTVESERPTVLFAGKIEMRKGIQYLPAIFGKIKDAIPDAVLEIAGEDSYARFLGMLKPWLQRQLAGLNESVRFLGPLSREKMQEAFARSWVLILPTRWDNFPVVVLEAMTSGKAVVTTPFGGMPEMLAETFCPIADPSESEFADKVVAFLRDRDLRVRAGQSASEKVARAYAPEVIVRKYIDFVSRCI